MAGLVPPIHVFTTAPRKKGVDARHKAGHDENDPHGEEPAQRASRTMQARAVAFILRDALRAPQDED
jgi:hypothetical protein